MSKKGVATPTRLGIWLFPERRRTELECDRGRVIVRCESWRVTEDGSL